MTLIPFETNNQSIPVPRQERVWRTSVPPIPQSLTSTKWHYLWALPLYSILRIYFSNSNSLCRLIGCLLIVIYLSSFCCLSIQRKTYQGKTIYCNNSIMKIIYLWKFNQIWVYVENVHYQNGRGRRFIYSFSWKCKV